MRNGPFGSNNRIDPLVMPRTVPPLSVTDDPLPNEPQLLKTTLLRNIFSSRRSLNTLNRIMSEEIVDELTLRLSTDPLPSMCGENPESDLPTTRRVWAPPGGADPFNTTNKLVIHCHGEHIHVAIEEMSLHQRGTNTRRVPETKPLMFTGTVAGLECLLKLIEVTETDLSQ